MPKLQFIPMFWTLLLDPMEHPIYMDLKKEQIKVK